MVVRLVVNEKRLLFWLYIVILKVKAQNLYPNGINHCQKNKILINIK